MTLVSVVLVVHERSAGKTLLLRAPLAAGRAKVHQRSNMRIFYAFNMHFSTHARCASATRQRLLILKELAALLILKELAALLILKSSPPRGEEER